jgi:hypothetical protein
MAFDPTKLLEPLSNSCHSIFCFLTTFRLREQQAYEAHDTRLLLPTRRERPRGRAAEQRDELTASHGFVSLKGLWSVIGGE